MPRVRSGVQTWRRRLRLGLGRTAHILATGWSGHKAWMAVLMIGAAVGGVAPVASAWLIRLLLDAIVAHSHLGRVLLVTSLAAGIAVLTAATASLSQLTLYATSNIRRGVAMLVQGRLFSAVNALPGMRKFEEPAYFDRLRLALQLGPTAPTQALQIGFQMLQSLITMVGFLAALLVISAPLCAVVTASSLPGLVAQLRLNQLRATTLWQNASRGRRQMFYAMLQADPQAAKELRLFGAAAYMQGRMDAELRSMNAADAAVDRKEFVIQALSAVLASLTAGAGLVYVVIQAAMGRLVIGDVALYLAAALGLQAGFAAMLQGIVQIQQSGVAFSHYEAVMATPPDVTVTERPRPIMTLSQGIDVSDVWFRYGEDQAWVLKGVTLKIPAGEAAALVGVNGAGKSTLIKILCRFYDPCRGAIFWDGCDLREFGVAELRRRMSVVFQDFMCYELTARENVALGDIRNLQDTPALHAAAIRAGVGEKLSGLPQGYDTMLGRLFYAGDDPEAPSRRLSGGEWQRVAVARALLRERCDLLILDEPGSGLDAEAEHFIHQSLRQLRRGRTTLLVSQRLSAVRDADHIVVLADGQVVEQGKHDDLMKQAGTYARLFTLQASGYATGDQESFARSGA